MGMKILPMGAEASCNGCGKRLLNAKGSFHFETLGQLAQRVIDLFWKESEDEHSDELFCPECQVIIEHQQGPKRDL